jgi:hypothetical protein
MICDENFLKALKGRYRLAMGIAHRTVSEYIVYINAINNGL